MRSDERGCILDMLGETLDKRILESFTRGVSERE
jgi:hypothetical protein